MPITGKREPRDRFFIPPYTNGLPERMQLLQITLA